MKRLTFLFLPFALACALSLPGCDLVNAIMDNGAPMGVSASDGDYANSISVSWSAPSLSSDKWKGYSVSHYEVSWNSESDSGYADNVYWTSFTISPAIQAQCYTVTVTAVLSGGWLSGGSSSDTGFALDTQELTWPDGGAAHAVGGTSQWYVTMLQRGFAYRFDFDGAVGGTVQFYPYKSLDPLAAVTLPAGSPTWTCDEDGAGHKFYVKVQPDSPGTGFAATCDNGYGF